MTWLDDLGDICHKNVPLGPLTWFKLGGAADYLVSPTSETQFAHIVKTCRESGLPLRVLGLGANLLVGDAGVRGVVVQLTADAFNQTVFDGDRVSAGAGVSLAKLILATLRKGLAGLEHLAGIPASVGGAIRMNCGGRYGDISTAVESVRVIGPNGDIYVREHDDLDFGYRHCNLGQDIVIGATFKLAETDPDALHTRFREIWMYKQNTQPPMGDHSAGCIFKNPEGKSAGQLIDQAGLKGLRIGGAYVSDRHANFIMAEAGAKADDVRKLIDAVRERVRTAHNIDLQTEIQIW